MSRNEALKLIKSLHLKVRKTGSKSDIEARRNAIAKTVKAGLLSQVFIAKELKMSRQRINQLIKSI